MDTEMPTLELDLSPQTISTAYAALSQADADESIHYPFDGIASKLLDASGLGGGDGATIELRESSWLIVYGTITTAAVGDDQRLSHIEQQAALSELNDEFPQDLKIIAQQVDIAATNILDSDNPFDDGDV